MRIECEMKASFLLLWKWKAESEKNVLKQVNRTDSKLECPNVQCQQFNSL